MNRTALAAPPLALPEALEEGILIWDPHGVVLNANEAMARLIGAPVDALIGQPSDPSALLAPGGGTIPPEQLPAARVERAKSRVDQEFGIPHADGGHVWVAARSAPRPDGTIISVYTPISEAEAKARASARIATLVDDSPDLVWMFDAHGLIEYASPSFSATLGLRQDEVIGRLWRALTHPLDVPVLRAAIGDAGPDEPRTGIIEVRLRKADGTWVWVEGQATLRFRGGTAIAVEIIGRDVTRTRAAEDAGRRLGEQLKALVAGAPYGILMLDQTGHIAVVNEQACSLLDLDERPEELIGRDTNVIMTAMERILAEPERDVARLREVAKTGETVRFVSIDCADGRRISYDHVPLGEEGAAGRLWSFRDITHLKLADEEQQQFLATMSHEIKTPLSGIAGAAELLCNSGLPDAERELAVVIADAAQALGGLVRDTLDVTRAEAGRAQPESEDYDPRRLLTSIAGVLRPSLRGRPLELLVEVDPEVPDALRGDPARVRQIVLNLASNAVKYTESGHARIGARIDDDRVLITVSDTGRGIAEEDLQRLFEPWTRNHTRAWAGTGLGLSIARRLARAMGGDVTVMSELGTGSAFTLELPLEQGELRPVAAARVTNTLSASRVLVAEDDAALRRLIGMQLERLGAQPTLVPDGKAAVGAAIDTAYDAILLDLRMPVMGGFDAAAAIRDRDPNIPILALTADTAAEDVERCRAAGMDGHIAKPVTLPALREELERRIAPVIDDGLLDELAESLGGRALVDQMLHVYRDSLPERLEKLRAATAPETLREAAHALRSPSAGFGIARLAARLQVVETAARAGRMAELGPSLVAAAHADRALAARLSTS
ncbi:ATP-binding protein [Solirubrobacter soli]|uniref:ATP-binding protein n=1 Tax=Solirubrobacter soli TaxID=363832 RepID=UPI00041A0B3F|nr:ATP-binding protein [Solirubrobacter soli]